MPNNYLTRGNEKLDKSILGWSLTPIISCLNCGDCSKDCYAIGPYNRYPAVKQAWDRNYRLAMDRNFKHDVIGQIERSRTVSAVRIHVAGDFFDQRYLNEWTEIVKALPQIKFYGYTKVMGWLNFDELLNCNNVNIINSIAQDRKPNFGDAARVKELVKLGYWICPATVKGNDTICGKDCKICQYHDKVCFHKH